MVGVRSAVLGLPDSCPPNAYFCPVCGPGSLEPMVSGQSLFRCCRWGSPGASCGGPGGRRGWAHMVGLQSQGWRASSPHWDHLDLGLDEGQIWDPKTNATKHERQGGRGMPRSVPRRTGTHPAHQGPGCLSESRGVCSPSDPQIT